MINRIVWDNGAPPIVRKGSLVETEMATLFTNGREVDLTNATTVKAWLRLVGTSAVAIASGVACTLPTPLTRGRIGLPLALASYSIAALTPGVYQLEIRVTYNVTGGSEERIFPSDGNEVIRVDDTLKA